MGWKDAGDAVVYPDGSQVKQPKALCELQGYVYDAKLRMAEIYDALRARSGDRAASGGGRAAAAIQRRFWLRGSAATRSGSIRDKRPIATVASNAGHCLWSGIADPDRPRRSSSGCCEPDMWSGWGIRTLSADHPAYNPFSYQLGSVWPHDNGIIAEGFKRYGFADEAGRVARDIFEAASYFLGYRLPELYAGLPGGRARFRCSTGANIPQAWAAGSVFQLVQTILGLRADAPHGRLYVDPALPRWLPDHHAERAALRRRTGRPAFLARGRAERVDAEVREGTIDVREEAWGPWVFELQHLSAFPAES